MSKLKNQPSTFVNKLYRMIGEETTNHLIRWGPVGDTFFVMKPDEFAKGILPRYFKHSNFQSFVRQLNMYGFHKVPHLTAGAIMEGVDDNSWEFTHDYFKKDREDLLIYVRRKINSDDNKEPNRFHPHGPISESRMIGYVPPFTPKPPGSFTSHDPSSSSLDLSILLAELDNIKKNQQEILGHCKELESNQAIIWNETLINKQKSLQQQEVLDKIVRFLASVFTSEKIKDNAFINKYIQAYNQPEPSLNEESLLSGISVLDESPVKEPERNQTQEDQENPPSSDLYNKLLQVAPNRNSLWTSNIYTPDILRTQDQLRLIKSASESTNKSIETLQKNFKSNDILTSPLCDLDEPLEDIDATPAEDTELFDPLLEDLDEGFDVNKYLNTDMNDT